MRSKVAVLRTTPETAVQDFGRLMELADMRAELRPEATTLLKVNISWHVYYPACSTSPWQLEGVIKGLLAAGFDPTRILAAQNSTVVVDPHIGVRNNKLEPVLDKYGVRSIWLNDRESEADWIRYEPKGKMLVLNDVYPDGLMIPKSLIGANIVHLPTLKTHVFTEMTGAMKNAFGGLLHLKRHWTHSVIHETLVDLLTIQKEIHPGVFAVMDGTISGDGPGPRAMRLRVTNLMLASRDQVAIDATAAKLMGFDGRRRRERRESGLFAKREHIRVERAEADLPRPAQAAGEIPSPEPARAVVVLRVAALPRRLLVSFRGNEAKARYHEERLGPAVPGVRAERRRRGVADP